jgi:hypothetical protein
MSEDKMRATLLTSFRGFIWGDKEEHILTLVITKLKPSPAVLNFVRYRQPFGDSTKLKLTI